MRLRLAAHAKTCPSVPLPPRHPHAPVRGARPHAWRRLHAEQYQKEQILATYSSHLDHLVSVYNPAGGPATATGASPAQQIENLASVLMEHHTESTEHRSANQALRADAEQLVYARQKVEQLTSIAHQLDQQRAAREGVHHSELEGIQAQTSRLQQLLESERQALTRTHAEEVSALKEAHRQALAAQQAEHDREKRNSVEEVRLILQTTRKAAGATQKDLNTSKMLLSELFTEKRQVDQDLARYREDAKLVRSELAALKQTSATEREKMAHRFQADQHTIKRLEDDRLVLIEQVAGLVAENDLRSQYVRKGVVPNESYVSMSFSRDQNRAAGGAASVSGANMNSSLAAPGDVFHTSGSPGQTAMSSFQTQATVRRHPPLTHPTHTTHATATTATIHCPPSPFFRKTHKRACHCHAGLYAAWLALCAGFSLLAPRLLRWLPPTVPRPAPAAPPRNR